MYALRAIVAGAGNPIILGSIATPVLDDSAQNRNVLIFDDMTQPRQRNAAGQALVRLRGFSMRG
nr:hypothetical protein [Marinicella sp. W31]MDC2879073.1 hypothetical protein [Marinicella sp. W31]